MLLYSVSHLWVCNKDSYWLLDSGLLTVEDLCLENLGNSLNDAALPAHQNTVNFWKDELADYMDDIESVPQEYVIKIYSNDIIKEGRHRLVALMQLGVSEYPVEMVND